MAAAGTTSVVNRFTPPTAPTVPTVTGAATKGATSCRTGRRHNVTDTNRSKQGLDRSMAPQGAAVSSAAMGTQGGAKNGRKDAETGGNTRNARNDGDGTPVSNGGGEKPTA